MKMRKSDINILLMVIGIALAACCYFFVYQKLTEKTEVLTASNAVLQQEVDYLQQLADNKEQYIKETETMQKKIDEIKAQFPAQYLPEDEIMYVVGVEDNYDAEVSSIGMGASSVIEVTPPPSDIPVAQDPAAAAPVEGEVPAEGEVAAAPATPAIQLYQTPVTVSMITSYNSIKEVIKKINEDEDRKAIDNLSMSFDSETGDLSANMSFTMFTLTGTEAVYTVPQIDGIKFGTNNIFNSADKKAAIEADKKAEEAAEEATAEEE